MTIKAPRDYQRDAIDAVIEGFKLFDRGQLILPCGAGKTLTSLWITQEIGANKALVVVPSLSLLKQIKDEWVKEGNDFPRLCVCSEKDIDTNDSIMIKTSEIDSSVTTDPDTIRNFMSDNEKFVIYSTYQSLDKIRLALVDTDLKFDLAICDEAHRCAGSRDKISKYIYTHNNKSINIGKRLYMTATPKVFSLRSQKSKTIYCMKNKKIFGDVFYKMSFGEAIQKDILVDYKIVAIAADINEIESDQLHKIRYYNNYALEKFMKEADVSHVITFHSSVKNANEFKEDHQKISKIPIHHVNGKQTSTNRRKILSIFEKEKKSIITNSRCLTEGVDVPSIDAVYFCDPKNSKIDIIQSAGRALRKSSKKDNKIGYIIVPIFHSPKSSLEEEIKESSFSNLISVIRALSEEDTNSTYFENKNHNEKNHSLPKNLILHGFENSNNFSEKIKEKIYFEIIERLSNTKSVDKYSFEEANKLIKKYNIKNAKEYKEFLKIGKLPREFPSSPDTSYKYEGWLTWSSFLGTKRIHASKRAKMLPTYEKSMDIVRNLNIKSSEKYKKYLLEGKFPIEMPTSPENFYKNKGWVDWATFVGKEKRPERFTYDELKKIVQESNISSTIEYEEFRKNHPDKDKMPFTPSKFYSRKGNWVSTKDLLGIKIYKHLPKKTIP